MNIKVLIDMNNLTATSTDPEVVVTELSENNGIITLEVSKPDPVTQLFQPFQGV